MIFNIFAFSISYSLIILAANKSIKQAVFNFATCFLGFLIFTVLGIEEFLTLPLSFLLARIIKAKDRDYRFSLFQSLSINIILFLYALSIGNLLALFGNKINSVFYDYIVGGTLILFSLAICYVINNKVNFLSLKIKHGILMKIIIFEITIMVFISFIIPLALKYNNSSLIEFAYYALICVLLAFIIGVSIISTYFYNNFKTTALQQEYDKINYDVMAGKYDEIVRIRHYYNRLFYILGRSIQDKDWEQAALYFNDYIRPVHENYILHKDRTETLNLIKIPLIKDLLIDVINGAYAENNVEIELDIYTNIRPTGISDFDLFIIVNEWLTNAVQAAGEDGRIWISFFQEPELTIVKVINTIVESVEIHKIENDGFTTKEGHSGKGLNSVRLILNKYENVFKNTYVNDNKFYQEVLIRSCYE